MTNSKLQQLPAACLPPGSLLPCPAPDPASSLTLIPDMVACVLLHMRLTFKASSMGMGAVVRLGSFTQKPANGVCSGTGMK